MRSQSGTGEGPGISSAEFKLSVCIAGTRRLQNLRTWVGGWRRDRSHTTRTIGDHPRSNIPLSGRSFTVQDDKNSPRVAIVNHEFAREIFGSVANAIGGYFKIPDGARIQVVEVAEDGKYTTLNEDPHPAMFLPILQWPRTPHGS